MKTIHTAIVAALCLLASSSAFAQNRVTISLQSPHADCSDSIYTVEIWATVSTSWLVGPISIVIGFNKDALKVIPDNPAQETDQLSDYGYGVWTQDFGIANGMGRIALTNFPPSTYKEKTGAFRLVLLRFRILNGKLPDNFTILTGGLDPTEIFHNKTKLTFNGGVDGYGIENPPAHTPFECKNTFWKATDCNSQDDIYTTDPVGEGAMHWRRVNLPANNFYHDVHYQYDFDPLKSPSMYPPRVSAFNINDLAPQTDWARCRWAAQCEGNNIHWNTTTTGGRFRWGTAPKDMYTFDNARSALAITALSLNPEINWLIVDTAHCGKFPMMTNGSFRSEIVFNNTDLFFNNNLKVKWTTNCDTCLAHGGTPKTCMDFRSVMLHELGHYLGLPHECNPEDIMTTVPYYGKQSDITQCDADRIRMLYGSPNVGAPPDNTTACAPVDVEETIEHVLDLSLAVYPTPVYSDVFTLQYRLAQSGFVRISLTDMFGTLVKEIVNREQGEGLHTLSCSVQGMSSGIYFVRLESGQKFLVRKVVVER